MVNVKSTRACMASYRGCFAVLVHSRTRIGLALEAVCVCVCVCVCVVLFVFVADLHNWVPNQLNYNKGNM